jgi:hypothetical protein
MQKSMAAALSRKAVSAGTLLLVGAGFALYPLTSLVLAPAQGHQIDLSLSIPTVEAQEFTAPLESDVNAVVGRLAVVAGTDSSSNPVVRRTTSLVVSAARVTRQAAPTSLPVVAVATVPVVPTSVAPVVAPVAALPGRTDRDHGRERYNPGRNGQQ